MSTGNYSFDNNPYKWLHPEIVKKFRIHYDKSKVLIIEKDPDELKEEMVTNIGRNTDPKPIMKSSQGVELPSGLDARVASFLSPKDLGRLSQVNKSNYQTMRNKKTDGTGGKKKRKTRKIKKTKKQTKRRAGRRGKGKR